MTRLLDVNEVAQMLGVHRQWLYDETAAGRFPAFKLGRLWRCDEADLARWLEQQKRRAA